MFFVVNLKESRKALVRNFSFLGWSIFWILYDTFALNGAFCGWPGRGESLLRAKLFRGGAGARNQVQSRAEYRCTLLFSSAISQ